MATNALKNSILMSADTAKGLVRNEFRFIVLEQSAMAAGASRSYNVATLLGTDLPLYDLKTLELDIRVIDTEPGSPTNSFFVSGEAVIASGFKTTGEVSVFNTFDSSLTVLIRARVNKKIS